MSQEQGGSTQEEELLKDKEAMEESLESKQAGYLILKVEKKRMIPNGKTLKSRQIKVWHYIVRGKKD